MWLGGWKSLVARMRWKGRAVRVLIVGAMVRPSGTASEPFWGGVSLTDILIVGVESCWFKGNEWVWSSGLVALISVTCKMSRPV